MAVIELSPKLTYNGEMRGEKVTNICFVCGQVFEDYTSNKRGNFCSLPCYWESKKGSTGYWLGGTRSEETKHKISETKKLIMLFLYLIVILLWITI